MSDTVRLPQHRQSTGWFVRVNFVANGLNLLSLPVSTGGLEGREKVSYLLPPTLPQDARVSAPVFLLLDSVSASIPQSEGAEPT